MARPQSTIAICPVCSKVFPTTPRRLRRPPAPCCSWVCAMSQRRRPVGDRFWPHVNKTDTCWLWTGYAFSQTGYGGISVGSVIDGTNTMVTTHKVAWEMASGEEVPNGLMVLHTCDVRRCVRNDEPGTYEVSGISYPRFGHLFLGPVEANNRDMRNKGRGGNRPWRRGAEHHLAVLSPAIALEVIARRNAGAKYKDLVTEFGVSSTAIRAVIEGTHWTVRGT